MPRFSVKDLLIATTLVAIGLAMLGFMPRYFRLDDSIAWAVALVGFALIGAGLCTPFHRRGLGAIIGSGIVVLLGVTLFILILLANYYD